MKEEKQAKEEDVEPMSRERKTQWREKERR